MSPSPKTKAKKSRLRLLHQYYSYTGFYKFVGSSLGKVLVPMILIIAALWAIHTYIIDFNVLFTEITTTYNPIAILAVFFASESFLGLVPPEIFIAWAGKTESPLIYLSLLAVLSYAGGIVSYFIGKFIAAIPKVDAYFNIKMAKHIKMIRRWGGFLIIVGALLPIPFSMTSIAAGVINYKFKHYLLFGLLRFVRFYLYAVVIFNLF
ncbi:MAG: VTT domain-containing protein [Gilvibacter sp.]